jgi:hypothetical protein
VTEKDTRSIVYEGPTRRGDRGTRFEVDGELFTKGVAREVDADLAEELLGDDSERLAGHKFSEADEPDDPPAPKRAKRAAGTDTAEGGPGGAGQTQGNPSGTARGQARS